MNLKPVFNLTVQSLLLLLPWTTILAGTGAALVADDHIAPPMITVSGKSTVQVVPDRAVLTASVKTRNKNLDAGVAENDSKIKSVVDFLKQSGVQDKNIRTEIINIKPIYQRSKAPGFKPVQKMANAAPFPNRVDKPEDEFEQMKPIGHTITRQFRITITQLDKFESIYRGLINAGINDIGGIAFETSQLRDHKDTARLNAVKAAKEKAKAMVGVLGAKLAFVQTITEDQYAEPRFSNSVVFNPTVPSTETTAGTIEIKASVRVVFLLKENEVKD